MTIEQINEAILASLVNSARALRSNDGLSDEELRSRFNHFSVPLAYRELRLYHERDEPAEAAAEQRRQGAEGEHPWD